MKTIRQTMADILAGPPVSSRELAEILLLRQAQVEEHLAHIQRSRRADLRITPAVCLACDYHFDQRQRLDAPGRCPRCHGQRIAGPWFHLAT